MEPERPLYSDLKDLVRIICSGQEGMNDPSTDTLTSWRPDSAIANDPNCFAPCIARRFLNNPEREKPACIKCWKTRSLDLLPPDEVAELTDITPVQFRCGHFVGHKCFMAWIWPNKTANACPVCKHWLDCLHCQYVSLPCQVNLKTIIFLPKTLPQIGAGDTALLRCPRCAPYREEQVREQQTLERDVDHIFSEYQRIATASPNLSTQEIEQEKQRLEQAAHRLSEGVRRYQRWARW
ncbi:hypothetical protein V8F20_002545 [Naviculisporaceae sp. PSN 640]